MQKTAIELDESFISKLFELVDEVPPDSNVVNLQVLKKKLYEIGVALKNQEEKINELEVKLKRSYKRKNNQDSENESVTENSTENLLQQHSVAENFESNFDVANHNNFNKIPTLKQPSQVPKRVEVYDEDGCLCHGRVLIIDDLGVITYQLRMAFKKHGFAAVTSREIVDAIKQFKKVPFDLVVMDLFIPTEREGYILLDALRNISLARNDNAIIAVMSASSTKDHRANCTRHGAAFFVEKCNDWQEELFSTINQHLNFPWR